MRLRSLLNYTSLFFLFLVLYFGISWWLNKRRLARLTAQAPAQVLDVNIDSTFKSRRLRYDTYVKYSYEVDGKPLVKVFKKGGNQTQTFKVGAPAKACYNPANPWESEVFSPDYVCGQ